MREREEDITHVVALLKGAAYRIKDTDVMK